MSKGLEALQEIKSKPFSWEKLKDSLDTIEKELKALEIIKKYYVFEENQFYTFKRKTIRNKETKEEYDLLKEVLK